MLLYRSVGVVCFCLMIFLLDPETRGFKNHMQIYLLVSQKTQKPQLVFIYVEIKSPSDSFSKPNKNIPLSFFLFKGEKKRRKKILVRESIYKQPFATKCPIPRDPILICQRHKNGGTVMSCK